MDFCVLGPFEVVVEGRSLDVGAYRQSALLALLLTRRGQTVTTERIAELLWDDRPPAHALNNVQSYVSRLRRVLHNGHNRQVLLTRGHGYVLDVPADDVDAERFITLADAGGEALSAGELVTAGQLLTDALALWRGEAYEQFASETFAREEIARLHEVRLRATEDRLQAELELGHHRAATPELATLVERHPLRERLRELLMLALYRSGRHVDALETYRRGREQLAEELGVDPGPGLQRLEQAILRHDEELLSGPPTSVATASQLVRLDRGHPRAGSPPAVGREAEIAKLRGALAAAMSGSARVIAICGEPGIGKTRLAEELADAAMAEGAAVRWGRCFEGGGAPAFWPWSQVVRAVVEDVGAHGARQAAGMGAQHLAKLVPDLKDFAPDLVAAPPRDAKEDRFRLYDAIVRLLRGIAVQRAMVVILDDIHWADIPSLHLLQLLTVQAADVPLLVLVTYRDTDPDATPHLRAAMAELSRQRTVQRLDLDGLDQVAVRNLAKERLGVHLEDDAVGVLQERTGGNPLYLTELLRFLSESGHEALGKVGLRAFVPSGARDIIAQRVAMLPDETRATLDAAAVVGRDFSIAVVAAVMSIAPGDVLERLEPAVNARVIARADEGPHRYHFRHAILRETITQALPVVREVRLHADVANALRAVQPASLGQIAHHYARAAAIGYAEQAVDALVEAADEARRLLAFETAEQHLRHALELLEQHTVAPDRELAVHTGLIDLVTMLRGYTAPEILDAVERARRACSTSDQPEAGALLWGAWSGLCVLADFSTAATLADELTAHAHRTGVTGEGAIAAIARGVTAWHLGRLEQASADLEEAVRLADLATGESERWSRPKPSVTARCFLADVRYLQGRQQEANQLTADAADRAERGGLPYERCFVRVVPLALLVDDGHRSNTVDRAAEAIALADQHGFRQLGAMAQIRAGWAKAQAGDPAAGALQIEEGYSRFRLTGAGMLRPVYLGWLGYALEAAAYEDRALQTVEKAIHAADTTGEMLFVSELYRLKGQLLQARHDASAMHWLRLAHATALAQGAAVFARRAQHAIDSVQSA